MDDLGASPVVATLLILAVTVVLGVSVLALGGSAPTIDVPEAVLDAGTEDGWIHVRHLGGEAFTARVRTVVDGVPWTTPPRELVPGTRINVSRPAADPDWAVRVAVLHRGEPVHEEHLRDGTRSRGPPDLVPTIRVADGRITATVTNLGASPTPEGKHTIVYFYVDGEDPADDLGWASNRNLSVDPVPPGGGFVRTRRFDPARLDDGPHTFEVVVNINAAGEVNIPEADTTNNEAEVTA